MRLVCVCLFIMFPFVVSAKHHNEPTKGSAVFTCKTLSYNYIWTDGSIEFANGDHLKNPFILYQNDEFMVIKAPDFLEAGTYKITRSSKSKYKDEILGHKIGQNHERDGSHGDFGAKIWFFNGSRLHVVDTTARMPKQRLKGDYLDYPMYILRAECNLVH